MIQAKIHKWVRVSFACDKEKLMAMAIMTPITITDNDYHDSPTS